MEELTIPKPVKFYFFPEQTFQGMKLKIAMSMSQKTNK
jgi:hypothetical protein